MKDLSRVRAIHIMDRNDNNFELPELMNDYRRMLRRPEIVIMLANRAGIQSGEAAGAASDLGERGHNSLVQGMGGDEIGIGWSTIQSVVLQPLLAAVSHPEYPVAAVSKTLQDHIEKEKPVTSWSERFSRMMQRLFGVILFSPNAIEQSEDLVAVWQANYDTISLGGKPYYAMRVSRSKKIRESFNMTAAFTPAQRWSMGLAQAQYQHLNQVIQILGPLPVDEKDSRRNVERHYLSSMFNLLTLVIVPVSILLDFTPFVGINALFWLAGLYFNQVLRAHGFVAMLRDAGLNKQRGVFGAIIASLLFYFGVPWLFGIQMHATWSWGFSMAAFAWIGYLTGYSPIGFGKWLIQTARDPMLFAARQVVEAVSFVMGTGGANYIFGQSQGADGPEEYETWRPLWGGTFPWDDKQGWKNTPWSERIGQLFQLVKRTFTPFSYRLVIVIIGPAVLLLFLFSFVYGLDFSNVVMLFPLIYYALSITLGTFIYQNRQGVAARGGKWLGRVGATFGLAAGIFSAFGSYQFMSGQPFSRSLVTFNHIIAWAPIFGASASIISTVVMRWLVKRKRETRSDSMSWPLVSQFSRKFWHVFIAFLPFAIVQIPDFVRMSIGPNLALPIGFWQAFFLIRCSAVVVGLIILIGWGTEYMRRRKQLELHQALTRARYMWSHQLGSSAEFDTLDAYLMDALLNIRNGAYGKVDESLQEADSLWQKIRGQGGGGPGVAGSGDFGGLDGGNGWLDGYRRSIGILLKNNILHAVSSLGTYIAKIANDVFDRIFKFNAVPAVVPKKMKVAA